MSQVNEHSRTQARWPVCGRCSHPGPLHSKDGEPAPCGARGCHGGPDNEPCPGFISAEEYAAVKALADAEAQAAQEPPEPMPSRIEVGVVEELKTDEGLRERMRAEGIDPDVVYAQAKARAEQLRKRIDMELTEERQQLAYRAAAGVAVILAAVLVVWGIRAVRKRVQGDAEA